ncbi:MAG: hypothetical protein AMXMBFR13_10620 [Phycisphaerae bacterium]
MATLRRPILSTLVVCLLPAGFLLAQPVLYVDDDAPAGGDGQSWATSYNHLQDALTAVAASGGSVNEIRVAGGTYRPDLGSIPTVGDQAATFQLLSGVALRGGYAGLGAFDPDSRDLAVYVSTLSGDLNGDDGPDFTNRADNAYHVVTANGTDATAVLDGFTVRGGSSNGGGLYNAQGSPAIQDCTFTDNSAGNAAGVKSVGAATFDRCTISGNMATWSVGGIDCEGGVLRHCDISNNRARNGTGGLRLSGGSASDCSIRNNQGVETGGGVWTQGDASLTRCTIAGNRALASWQGAWGGGLLCEGITVLTACVVVGNTVEGIGGGICGMDTASLTLDHCLVYDNNAIFGVDAGMLVGERLIYGGGIAVLGWQAVIIRNSTIRANRSKGAAGGLYGAMVEVSSSCIAENEAEEGGGGILAAALSMINCTVVANRVNQTSGAAYGGGIRGPAYHPATMTNCIVSGNWAPRGAQISGAYDSLAVRSSNVQGGLEAVFLYPDTHMGEPVWEDNLDVDPGFALGGDYHLAAGSPCIDAGSSTPAGGLPATDLDGRPRLVDGDGDGTAMVDMGAYELDPATPTLAVSPGDFRIGAPLGGESPPPRTLQIRNSGGGVLSWQVTCDCPWITIEPTTGVTAGEIDEVLLTITTAGLPRGSHTCSVSVSEIGGAGMQRKLDVVLDVNTTLRVPSEYATIQAAIDAAVVPGDTVLIADGIYSGPGNQGLWIPGRILTIRSENGAAACAIEGGMRFDPNTWSETILDGITVRDVQSSSGAIRVSGHPIIQNCIIEDCTSTDLGGGVYLYLSHATIRRCVIRNNTALRGAGVYAQYCDGLRIVDCEIYGNTASQYGGGIAVESSKSAWITQCTIHHNTASGGGGVYLLNKNHQFDYGCNIDLCTITQNTAHRGGGLISTYASDHVRNSIFWGNSAINGSQLAVSNDRDGPHDSFALNVDHCDVQGGQDDVHIQFDGVLNWGAGNIDADPRFYSPTDYHLTQGSPCIDAGDNGLLPPDVLYDAQGQPRRVDDPATPDTGAGEAPIVDMGAYEFDLSADHDHDSVADGIDNCPYTFNPDQANKDSDVYGDACDACPRTIPGVEVDADGCPAYVPGDFDRDGDVDLEDFGFLQVCLGPAGLGLIPPGCEPARLDGDVDVDQEDFGVFQRCLSGPNRPADPECNAE